MTTIIDLRLPDTWKSTHIWFPALGRGLILVAAFSPRVVTIGAELILGTAHGLALYVGPFCFVVAAFKPTASAAPTAGDSA